ncbi:MAG: hypothetical protein NXI29_05595 [bacterium]|nr:hypothetical protein [bacterium]
MTDLPKECNNPASRLYNLFQQLPNSNSALKTLSEKFKIERSPEGLFTLALDIHREYALLSNAIDMLPDESPKKNIFKANLVVLEKEINNINLSVNNGINISIGKTSMNALQYMAIDFQNESDGEELLNDLREKIRELQNLIERSELNPELKKWLLSLLRSMRDGVDRYFISGARSIDEEFTKIVGELVLNPQMKEEIEKTDKNLYDKFVSAVNVMKTFKSFYTICKPITQEVALRLPYFLE